MRRRCGAALALAVAGVAGCGGSGADGGDESRPAGAAAMQSVAADATRSVGANAPRASGLAWVEPPVVFTPDGLPRDRILSGRLRNDSGRPVELRVDRVTVFDTSDHRLRSNVRFVEAFGHGLYGPGGPPAPLRASRYDQQRLGERVTLQPGRERPVTVAWRLPGGGARAARVRVSSYVLAIPAG